MTELVRLPLETAQGQPLPHKLYRQGADPAGLVILLPGVHYGVDGALLFYPSRALQRAGWDSLALTYSFQSSATEFNPEMIPEVIGECTRAARTALSARRYPRVGLVGKSLGTGLAAFLCRSMPELSECRSAYLTPTLGTPLFDPIFRETAGPALIAIGTADRFYDREALDALGAERSFQLTLVEGADHSMEVEDDLEASLMAVARVTADVVHFMRAD